MLEQYLVSDPESVSTVVALFRLYLQMDDLDMAEQLLVGSSRLPSLTILEMKAQIKVHQGDLLGAVKMLESVTPDYDETTYHALLAGLYQKMGRFEEAARHYRYLLNNEPGQGVFWLGLAVSLDSLNSDKEALSAFQRTRDTGHYDGDVQHYVEERIRVLSQR